MEQTPRLTAQGESGRFVIFISPYMALIEDFDMKNWLDHSIFYKKKYTSGIILW